jgi:hypothetical protein
LPRDLAVRIADVHGAKLRGRIEDEEAIRTLIGEHFEAMRWEPGTNPDWDRFRADFIPEAHLFGAARPVQARTVDSFIERMETVARKNLHIFEEHTRGMKILRFGDIAVALAMSELLENGEEENHDISGYLLVKSEGRWSIAAHAWDQASNEKPVPDDLR